MNNGTTIQSKHKQQSQLQQFDRRGPRHWAVYVLVVLSFPSSMGGHAAFLCSPPQWEQMCWKRHGITAHGLPSFQAKHATTRLLFGRNVGPLSEGPWTDLKAPPDPEDKRHLVYSAWSRRPNLAFSKDGTCWRKRESYARHVTLVASPTGLWPGTPTDPRPYWGGNEQRFRRNGRRPSPIPAGLPPGEVCAPAMVCCPRRPESAEVPPPGSPPTTPPCRRSPLQDTADYPSWDHRLGLAQLKLPCGRLRGCRNGFPRF